MGRGIFLNVSGGGHVIATYGLVGELVQRGERIIYYEAPRFQAEIEALGAEFRPYPAILPYPGPRADYPYHHELDLPPILTWCALQWIPQLLNPIRAAAPDYIVHDSLCVWGRVIAQILGVPAFCSVHTPALNWPTILRHSRYWRDLPRMAVRSFASLRYFRTLSRELRDTYGVSRAGFVDLLSNVQPDTICHAPRELQPHGESFGAGYHFIGSVHTRPTTGGTRSRFPMEKLVEPFIYVGFGTICDPGPAFFRNCVRAFGGLDMQVVLILSASTTPEDLGEVPANVIVWSLARDGLAPQLEILPRASLFVMNGGNGGARESAWFGVPMIAVPTTFETDTISMRIAAQGAGIRIVPGAATPQRLLGAARAILADPSYRRSSARIGDACRAAGGSRYAADLIRRTIYSSESVAPPNTPAEDGGGATTTGAHEAAGR
jgi:MGT family glycosyltransferase